MADSFREEILDAQVSTGANLEMAEGAGGNEDKPNNFELPFAEGSGEDPPAPRVTFLQYLTSPIITLLVGSGDNETILTAHQGLLTESPFFSAACAEFLDDGSPHHIELPSEDFDAISCFLEFLYTGDYFPRKIPGQRALEKDSSTPDVDATGDQLLKHAKVYTLAEKFGLSQLKNLAWSKIHLVKSTAMAEIAYARYVYEFTSKDDSSIRAPVASFWATRSHTLCAEAEEQFRGLCLEFPQFGYDILTRVLNEKLKRERDEKLHLVMPSSARKRPRHSSSAAAT
ncbi:hypothetical protein B0T26DRAFT_744221 [Lasiosphaeria miniovina]|uniref:BTB domain-containing protein n=1 Tax=Lasiosphaeria miniovina TaxID=1954250 RepID=A0AA40DKK7_9PEZI|nr:uncharacterized protein B0T26DRAFT_744221 [Lasiosphaeria miniovina]KAK0703248.1 hypothetical protein B0T26DRAFT_744221 [Lasiosphaeria miniovina]